jgi:hypothetical protein
MNIAEMTQKINAHRPRPTCKKTDNKTKNKYYPGTEIRTQVAGLEGRNLNHYTKPT